MTAAREAAYRIRREVERGRRLDLAFAAVANDLEPKDRGFVHELTYGVTRLRGRLDHVLARQVDRGLASLDGPVLEVLRLGAYQILYMDSVPAFAAVSESVDQVREVGGRRAGGLVNAVLRRVADDGARPDLFPDAETDPLGYLETWGSHPRWLVERWLSRWAYDEVARLVAHDNHRPFTYLRALELPTSEVLAHLASAGITAEEIDGSPGTVRLGDGVRPIEALTAVPGSIIQDPAAGWVVRYADIDPGTDVADLCAAPGGKTLGLAGSARRLIAADRSERRVALIREALERVGGSVRSKVSLLVADALHPPLSPVDAVLLDAPCSGTGTLQRHPDARWRLRPETIDELAVLQARMLAAAASLVRPGGLLVYATCTLEEEENGRQVAGFLADHAAFRIEPPTRITGKMLDGANMLRVTPQDHHSDGAFAARLRRTG